MFDEFLVDALPMTLPEKPPMRVDQLLAKIRKHRALGPIADELVALVTPSIGLLPGDPDDDVVGGPRLLGVPDLPAGLRVTCYKGQELSFLLQAPAAAIHDVVAGAPLPREGHLFVFAALDHAALLWSTKPPRARRPRRAAPPGLPVELVERASLPSPHTSAFEARGLTREQRRAYEKLWHEVQRTGRTQLLGDLAPHQGHDPCVGSKTWRPLLQLDLEEVFDESGGAACCVYVAIKARETSRGRFDKVLCWADR